MKSINIHRAIHFVLSPLAAVCLLAGSAGFARAQTLLNGGFEAPVIASGFAYGGGDNWTPSGTAVAIGGNVNQSNPQTIYGSQYLILSSTGSPATDTQTISGGFIIGKPYSLSLACADGSRASDDQLTVTISGGATAAQVFNIPFDINAGTTGHVIPFSTYSLTFVPTTNAPVTITLSASRMSGIGVSVLVDNVVLTVPEPATWTTLGTGAVLLGVLARRRRKAVS